MTTGVVYLICENGDNELYKIGVTRSDVESRLKKLQTGNGNPLYCVDTFQTNTPYRLEKMLHNYFSTYREEGEWFLFRPEQVNEFKTKCIEFQNVIDSLQENPFF